MPPKEEEKKTETPAAAKTDAKDDKPQVQPLQFSIREVGSMKKGDYMVHVFIENARQLKMAEGATVDPIVEVQVLNEKKYTTAKDDIGAAGVVSWQEHLFYEPKNLTVEQIEGAKISIRVLDKGYFKDALIGMYEFDVAYIYFMKQHSLLHRWVALSNPSSPNFSEVCGYLKLSISVATGGDEQIQISEDTGSDKTDEESIMMPPQMKPEFYQLRFRFFKAEKLPIMDKALFGSGGSIDAYIICHYLNQKLKTKIVTMKNDQLYWNQEFLIPVQLPIMSGRLVMKLYDEDKLGDEIVGSIIFNLKDCIEKRNGLFFWKNIYGAPLDKSGENTNMMNSNPDIASTWKGRILMQVTAEKTESPLIKVEDLTDDVIQLANPYYNPREYEIIAEVGQGIALPDAKKYNVKIKIADFELKTEKPQVADKTFNRWNHRFQKATYTVNYQDVYDMGKVYFYLMDGDNAVCYAKDDIENFMNPDPKIRWLELTPDLSVGKVTEHHKAGLISVKLSIHDKSAKGPIDFNQFPAWKKPPPKRPNNFKVRAYVFQCRDLPAADSDGQSDPYIIIWDTSKEVQMTKYIEDNVNPLFYQTIELVYEANAPEDLPPFIFDVYDKDFNPLDSDDFICRAIIPINEAAISYEDNVPKPKWHTCRMKAGAPDSGEVLVSFSIVDADYNFKKSLKYMNLMETVDFKEYKIELNILGLRNLQSVGILPVKKAFITFNLKSLVPPDCATAIENIKTQPGPAGPNPTINTLIDFKMPLPCDPLYCPKLQCSVFDNIFKSYFQPLLGVFTIPVGEILFSQQAKRIEDIKQLDQMIIELDKIIEEVGAVTYNVTENIVPELHDPTLRKSIASQKEEVQQAITQNVTEEDQKKVKQLTRPLLANLDSDEYDGEMERLLTKKKIETPKKAVAQSPVSNSQSNSNNQTPNRTPRKTPQDMVPQSEEKKKGGFSNMFTNRVTFFNKRENKSALLNERKEDEEKRKREEQEAREKEMEEMKRAGSNPFVNILKPKYRIDPVLNVAREITKPPDSLYIGLGYDDVPEDDKKHYRRYYPDELENVKELMPNSPFIEYPIKRGQTRGASKSFWSFGSKKEDESGSVSTELVVGKFKCLIDITSEVEKKEYEEAKEQRIHDIKHRLNLISLKRTKKPINFNLEDLDTQEGKMAFRLQMEEIGVAHLNLTKQICSIQANDSLKRLLLNKTKTIVRLYVVSAYDLAKRDIGSDSDPYLRITLGNKVIDERDQYQLDEPNPDFMKSYDFEAVFPGCPMLNLAVYDFDDLFGDDLIGDTNIDLEDRFFSPEWNGIKDKPIEYRQLYHSSSSISQGVVKCWVEIIPTNMQGDIIHYDITKRPPIPLEVRVCVFDTIDIKMMDAEGTSDVFIRTFFDSKECVKETDTHFRCQTGKASFNYRLLFNIEHPRRKNDYALQVQAFDRDFFKSNDIIGETKIDLRQAIEDVILTKRPISLNKSYYTKILKQLNKDFVMDFKDDSTFWVQLVTRGKDGKLEKTGKVRLQIDIYPKALAEMNKVGEARQEPNANPFLPPPVGRLSFSLNPLKMFQQLVGPALRRKIYGYCCLAACFAICILSLPSMLGQLFTAILMAPFN